MCRKRIHSNMYLCCSRCQLRGVRMRICFCLFVLWEHQLCKYIYIRYANHREYMHKTKLPARPRAFTQLHGRRTLCSPGIVYTFSFLVDTVRTLRCVTTLICGTCYALAGVAQCNKRDVHVCQALERESRVFSDLMIHFLYGSVVPAMIFAYTHSERAYVVCIGEGTICCIDIRVYVLYIAVHAQHVCACKDYFETAHIDIGRTPWRQKASNQTSPTANHFRKVISISMQLCNRPNRMRSTLLVQS